MQQIPEMKLNNEEKCIEDIKVRVKKAMEKLASTNLTDVQANRVFAVDKQKTTLTQQPASAPRAEFEKTAQV